MTTDNTMTEFVYAFGYEGVDEDRVNRETGSDFESFAFFRIRAGSEAAALAWGRTLSDWYVAAIFGDSAPGRWSRGEYACWIERDPEPEGYATPGGTNVVECGEYPDLLAARRTFYD